MSEITFLSDTLQSVRANRGGTTEQRATYRPWRTGCTLGLPCDAIRVVKRSTEQGLAMDMYNNTFCKPILYLGFQ